jgi:hypothetical protein
MFIELLPIKYLKIITKSNSNILHEIIQSLIYPIYIDKNKLSKSSKFDFYSNLQKNYKIDKILKLPIGLYYYDFMYNSNYTLENINDLFHSEFSRLFGENYINLKYVCTREYLSLKNIKLIGLDNILNYLFFNIKFKLLLKNIIYNHTKTIYPNIDLEKDIFPYVTMNFAGYYLDSAIRHHTHIKNTNTFSIFNFDNSYLDLIPFRELNELPFRINFLKGTAITLDGIYTSYYTHGVPIGIVYPKFRYIFNISYPKNINSKKCNNNKIKGISCLRTISL